LVGTIAGMVFVFWALRKGGYFKSKDSSLAKKALVVLGVIFAIVLIVALWETFSGTL